MNRELDNSLGEDLNFCHAPSIQLEDLLDECFGDHRLAFARRSVLDSQKINGWCTPSWDERRSQ